MNKITQDFISNEKREYKFKIGNIIASSLSGFIGGLLAGGIIVWVIFRFLEVK